MDLRHAQSVPGLQHSASSIESDQEDSSSEEHSDIESEVDMFDKADLFPNRAKTSNDQSTFDEALNELAKLFSDENVVGDNISEGLGNIINGSLRRRPNDENIKKAMDKYPRPENLTNLTIPKTKQDVWNALNMGSAVVDGLIQKVQGMLSKVITIIVKYIDDIGHGRAGSGEDHLIARMDRQRCLSAAFATL